MPLPLDFRLQGPAAAADGRNARRTVSLHSGVLENRECLLISGGGIADHIHLLIRVPPKRPLSDIVRDIKANSSRWLREKWPKAPFAWQDGYGLFTVSMSLIAKTKDYIERQEEHHRGMTSLDEFKRYLANHEIHFEARFLEGADQAAGPTSDAPAA